MGIILVGATLGIKSVPYVGGHLFEMPFIDYDIQILVKIICHIYCPQVAWKVFFFNTKPSQIKIFNFVLKSSFDLSLYRITISAMSASWVLR